MTPSWSVAHSPASRREGASFHGAAVAAILAATTLVALGAPSAAATPGPALIPLSWSNGVVHCNFTSDHPAVTVSAVGASRDGLYLGLYEVDELDPSGAVVASASMFSANWTIGNWSGPENLTLGYTAPLPVLSRATGAPTGFAGVRVGMSTAYDGAAAGHGSQVDLNFTVDHWPWLSAQDVLDFQAPAWPASPSAERLALVPSTPMELESDSVGSGQLQEYAAWGPQGEMIQGGHALSPVPVATHVEFGANYSTITWTFGNSSAGAASLSFDAQVDVVLPAHVLGLPVYEYVLASGAAVAVSLVGAVGMRWARRRPSSLEYVEEEER